MTDFDPGICHLQQSMFEFINKTIQDVKPGTEEREREKETHHKRSQLVSSNTFMGMVPIGSQLIISNINILYTYSFIYCVHTIHIMHYI